VLASIIIFLLLGSGTHLPKQRRKEGTSNCWLSIVSCWIVCDFTNWFQAVQGAVSACSILQSSSLWRYECTSYSFSSANLSPGSQKHFSPGNLSTWDL
jgi:hypothetical protein